MFAEGKSIHRSFTDILVFGLLISYERPPNMLLSGRSAVTQELSGSAMQDLMRASQYVTVRSKCLHSKTHWECNAIPMKASFKESTSGNRQQPSIFINFQFWSSQIIFLQQNYHLVNMHEHHFNPFCPYMLLILSFIFWEE